MVSSREVPDVVGNNLLGRRSVLLGAAAAMGGAALARSHLLPSAHAAEPLQKVNIVTTSGALFVGQLMQNQRYLQQFGIDGNIIPVADGGKALNALISGDSDIAVGTGFAQVLVAIEKGAKVKIIAGGGLLSDAAMYTSKPDIKSCKDLVGRTVGVGALGSVLHQIVTALLKQKGVDPSTVNFVNVGSNADVFRAVVAGTVDAGPGAVDVWDDLPKYKLHALTDGRLWVELPNYTNQATYVTDKAIAEKRDLIVRTLAAYRKLYVFMQDQDSFREFAAALAQATSKDDPAAAQALWKFFQDFKMYGSDLALSEQRVRFMQELNVESGAQKTIMPYDQITDMSLARDAMKLAGS
jgi:ABC-type nitrate/sulfonate/bicarbonate transport system substrate-binding protein